MATKKIKAMKAIRKGFAMHIGRILNETDTLSADVSKVEIYERSANLLLEFKQKFTSKSDEILNLLIECEDVTDEDIEKETSDMVEMEVNITKRVTELRSLITSTVKVKPEKNTDTENQTTVSKLPKLTLPHFSGSYEEYISFIELFDLEVGTNSNIDDGHKFSYLVGCLEGKAKESVKGIIPSASNYKTLRTTLQENFGKPGKIIRSLVLRLVNLKCAKNAQELREFYNEFMSTIRSLDSMKINVQVCAPIIISITEEKLPNRVKMELSVDEIDIFDFEAFRMSLLKQVEKFETGSVIFPVQSEIQSPSEGLEYSTATFANNSSSSTIMTCRLCQGAHSSGKCTLTNDEIISIVKDKRLCLLCLSDKHWVRNCTSQNKCYLCQKRHHIVLHGLQLFNSTDGKTVSIAALGNGNDSRIIFLKTAKAIASERNNSLPVNILFDEGSQRSYILLSTADRLGLVAERYIELTVNGFNSKTRYKYGVSRLCIHTQKGPTTIEVLITKKLVAPINQVGWKNVLSSMNNVRLANDLLDDFFFVDILIGNDYVWEFFTGKSIVGISPVIQFTTLGAVLSGPQSSSVCQFQSTHSCYCLSQKLSDSDNGFDSVQSPYLVNELSNFELYEKVNSLFKSNYLPESSQCGEIEKSSKYIQEYKSKVLFKGGKYHVPLPWNESKATLPSNINLCKHRFLQIVKRLNHAGLMEKYRNVIAQHISAGYIEEVIGEEAWVDKNSHYLPHFYVLKDSTTTPLRIVFAANTGSPSLNDCLLTGPCLLKNLSELLWRFRVHEIALVADIAQAFLNVKLVKEDRNYVKFIWFKDNNPENVAAVFRCTTVVFGHTSSPFVLGATLDKHFDDNDSEVANDMRQKMYVDNLITGVHGDEIAVSYYYAARKLMKEGGFNLRQWLSNSTILNHILGLENSMINKEETSVLGMKWNSEEDNLSYYCRIYDYHSNVTKRTILSEVASVFDPLGWLSPVFTLPRIFINKLWRGKYDWDDKLPRELLDEWYRLKDNLQQAMQLRIPRFLGVCVTQEVQLHLFVDANMKALGAVIYMKQNENIKLVGSKSKIVNTKSKSTTEDEYTIPKLELKAMVLGSKFLVPVSESYGKDMLKIKIYCWSDSQVALYWINSNKKLTKFVEADVNRVVNNSKISWWNYVKSKDNPADLITRGLGGNELVTSELWLRGPKWLSVTDHWPAWQRDMEVSCYSNIQNSTDIQGVGVGYVIDCTRFSTLDKLFRVTCLVKKFCTKSWDKVITKKDLEEAEIMWVKYIQQNAFPEELQFVTMSDNDKHGPPRIRQLNIKLDKVGILRAAGRTYYCVQPPILLPNCGWFVKLIIEKCHKTLHHFGVNSTVVALRKRYWILQGELRCDEF